jgi:hypothetical protein
MSGRKFSGVFRRLAEKTVAAPEGLEPPTLSSED